MKKHKTYTVAFRRKREAKTNYKKRLKLLLSRTPRLVVRTSANNVLAQIIEYEAEGDKVLFSAHSNELVKIGWKGNLSNIPTAYLVGLLLAKKVKKVDKVILDIGMRTSTKGSRVFAVLKGALDGGLSVKHSEEILPSKDRIRGKHIGSYAELLKKNDNEKYKKIFSGYLKNGLNPEDIEKSFDIIKKKIEDIK